MLTMYGIKNCDTIKKARRWLEAHQIEYRFHDYRADGLERAQLDTFIAELGWQALLNTRGTTWRKLDESLRNSIDNAGRRRRIDAGNAGNYQTPIALRARSSYAAGF
ncbi:a glutathione-dependent thiol reductase [Klebsiella pneumoniae]|nr:a glutathione-dependent thiol reductase [Klebsiella pneumoniae]